MARLICDPFKTVFFALCAACCLNACSQSTPDYSGTTTVRMYRNSDTDIITLKIPRGYLDHYVLAGPAVPGAKEDTAPVKYQMFFIAEAGTLKPRSKENNQAFEYPNSLTDEISFNIFTWFNKPQSERSEVIRKQYQLQESFFNYSCTSLPKSKFRFGMDWYVRDLKFCKKLPMYEKYMLVEKNSDGEIRTQILCTSDEIPDLTEQIRNNQLLAANPKCEHRYYFKDLNASIELRYSRIYVKDWKQLEEQINALLLSFVEPAKALK